MSDDDFFEPAEESDEALDGLASLENGKDALRGAAAPEDEGVRGTISNTHLENALTTPTYGFRVLGLSELLELAFRSVVTFTGNNIVLGGDMPRRTIVGRLEPQTEHPERLALHRFRHPNIEDKARRERARYVAAALTILRAYMLAGAPDQQLSMGSFAEWTRLVGGALVWCGAGDITAYSGKESVTEPEEWSALRTLVAPFDPPIAVSHCGILQPEFPLRWSTDPSEWMRDIEAEHVPILVLALLDAKDRDGAIAALRCAS